jgi:hypothetical protein
VRSTSTIPLYADYGESEGGNQVPLFYDLPEAGIRILVPRNSHILDRRADIVASPGLLTQELVDSIRSKIVEMVQTPVVLQFSIIPETIFRSPEGTTWYSWRPLLLRSG